MTSQSCNELEKEFNLTSQKKPRLFWKRTFWGVCFTVYRNRERERERKGKLIFLTCDISSLSLYHLIVGGLFKIAGFCCDGSGIVALWLVCSLQPVGRAL